jgi:hypothetical protein
MLNTGRCLSLSFTLETALEMKRRLRKGARQ